MLTRLRYWRKGEDVQNFGDFLSEFISDILFFPLDSSRNGVHVIGSVIDDAYLDRAEDASGRIALWGCGARSSQGISPEYRQRAEILAVRGPLTASALRLGSAIPQGDPAFLLPALYSPRFRSEFSGKNVCIPHFFDARPDSEILELTGCDAILRPNIQNSRDSLLEFIDIVCSSSFVLTGSLHGAVVAAAYERPFGYFQSGDIDVPFKWEDLSNYLSILNVFHQDIRHARLFYEEHVAPHLSYPPLLPLISRAPYLPRPEAVLRIVQLDAKRNGSAGADEVLTAAADLLGKAQHHFDRIVVSIEADIKRKRQEVFDRNTELVERSHALDRRERELTDRQTEIVERLSRQLAEASAAVSAAERRRDESLKALTHARDAESQFRQYLLRRSVFERLFFRVDGRPTWLLRRLLFHNSGQPRRLFRILVLHKNGKPRRVFSYWMNKSNSDRSQRAEPASFSMSGSALDPPTDLLSNPIPDLSEEEARVYRQLAADEDGVIEARCHAA